MIIGKIVICPECNGEKVIKKTEKDLASVMKVYHPNKPCPNCNGRGTVYKEVQNV